ncbi:hypothetical protein ACWC10_06410 [Streptomyces sp. NPDC001595]|uniref:hypothetical protein n=1 Tax=Streptomyces sp. NPDC001532 TaxID=3154520 RepID=UPI003321E8DF
MDWQSYLTQVVPLVGPTVLALAVTDGYQTGKERLVRLFGRGEAERENAVRADLEGTTAALAAAPDEEARERARAEHAQAWEEEFTRLLLVLDPAERQRAASELREIAREVGPPAQSGDISLSGNTFHGPANVQVGHHSHQVNNNFGAPR